jgi:hypothetical protein
MLLVNDNTFHYLLPNSIILSLCLPQVFLYCCPLLYFSAIKLSRFYDLILFPIHFLLFKFINSSQWPTKRAHERNYAFMLGNTDKIYYFDLANTE